MHSQTSSSRPGKAQIPINRTSSQPKPAISHPLPKKPEIPIRHDRHHKLPGGHIDYPYNGNNNNNHTRSLAHLPKLVHHNSNIPKSSFPAPPLSYPQNYSSSSSSSSSLLPFYPDASKAKSPEQKISKQRPYGPSNSWIFTKEDLKSTPSIQDGMSIETEQKLRLKACLFIGRLAEGLRGNVYAFFKNSLL